MSIGNIHDWTEDDVPDHSRVVDALAQCGVDPDSIHATPEGVWYVGDQLAMGVDHDAEVNETWSVTCLTDDSLVATGDLETVAVAVAVAVAAFVS